MLKLKQVSKFYYSKGMVASGFSKISLSFDIGEFVAITGESGSGKSTLLNVISGVDSYEEGEMYINGEETSHYTEKDYEIYRKKYIGNIFQNFNLVNSYTVYQNIELVLLLNGKKKKDIKAKVNEIIKQVDLYKYRNRKVSKLSGGQKQRVAIARALAQNTPIILADEPTGNLDSRSSESVLKLLHEISKDKLVIVVTHNYDQIEKYATRKITMHDGKVLEDKKIKDVEILEKATESDFSDIKWYNKIRLGLRNTFNIVPKFLLIFTVYLFVVLSLFFVYSSFMKSEYLGGLEGQNSFFRELSDKRIIIKKNDKTYFTDEDYAKIEKISNVDKVIKDDLSLDATINVSDPSYEYWFYGTFDSINVFNGKVDVGRLPETDREVLLEINKDNYYVDGKSEKIFDIDYYLEQLNGYNDDNKYQINIVGITYNTNIDMWSAKFYFKDKVLNDINKNVYKTYSTLKYTFNNTENISYLNSIYGEVLPSSKVSKGKVVLPEEYSYQCKKNNCKKYKFYLNLKNIYYDETTTLEVSNVYKKSNFKKLTGYNYKTYNGAIFMNNEEYNNLFIKGYYQSTVMIKNEKLHEETIKELENMGLKTLYVKDTIYLGNAQMVKILKITKVIVMSILIVALFFISYFIIKLILKSRNVYYSTLRILGSSFKATKSLLNIELLATSHIAFIVFATFIYLISNKIINIISIYDLTTFITLYDYIFIYVVLLLMSLLITSRYSRKLFKNTIMSNYTDEV